MAVAQYNAPGTTVSGTPSTVGAQMNTFYWHKRAIIDAKKDMYFTPLADVINMPKNFGKEIRVFQYVPLLDDRNINDQGIDANGVTLSSSAFRITYPRSGVTVANAGKAAAVTAINDNVGATLVAVAGANDSGGTGLALLTMTGALSPVYLNATKRDAVLALDVGVSVKQSSGNLYGSSKDIGTIVGRLPTLTENGGRVNRVGFTRLQRSAVLTKLGFFTEFTQESFDFDSDEELYGHMSRELVTGATQLTEAVLQIDLLSGAGVVLYTGSAIVDADITGEGSAAVIGLVDYDDLMRLSTILNDNRTPKQTKVITGSRMIDTKTVSSGRVMYIGSELESTVKKMVDPFGAKAFIPIHQYADAGTILNGEIGTVDQFRMIVVPEMLRWAGAGAKVGTNPGYRETDSHYDIYPMLVVGGESFTTIGFQTDGKSTKFKIITRMPGDETADRFEPFGETGFSSIKWYYSTLIMRSERLAVVKTIARQ